MSKFIKLFITTIVDSSNHAPILLALCQNKLCKYIIALFSLLMSKKFHQIIPFGSSERELNLFGYRIDL